MNISNKFLCPHLSRTVLHRARLVEELTEAIVKNRSVEEENTAHYKFVLFYAPAGYGKTTILEDFAKQTGLPCCWYFLDTTDSDRIIFLQRLITSLRCCFPEFGQELEILVANSITTDLQSQASEHHFEILIDHFIQAIHNEIAQPFTLILSHYQTVNAHQGINQIVSRLLHHLPGHCSIIIESRIIPDLHCEYFLLHHELLVFGTNKLMFTTQEVCALAKLQGITEIEQKDAEKLTTYFEGWIAGILLGTHLSDVQFLSSHTEQWTLLEKPVNRKHLFSYVVNEVFNREPAVYTFLQKTSILARVIPDLCDALLGTTNAAFLLNHVEEQALFVTSSKHVDGPYYTYHPVMRDLFYEEMHEKDPKLFRELNTQAAIIFEQKGDYTQAIFHALEAQDFDFSARIIARISKNMLVQGYTETIARYIDALPPHILDAYPQLLLSRANIYLMEYKTGVALELLGKAYQLNQTLQIADEAKHILTAEILIAQSSALFHIGQYAQAHLLCDQAIHLLPLEERVLRALAYQRIGLCTSSTGDCKNGLIQLQQALQLWGQHTINRQTAFLYGQLAKTYNMIGNYALAEHHRARAISYWDQLGDIEGKINNLIGLGVTYFHQGTYAEAESILNQALALSRLHCFPRKEAYALINLGELAHERGHYKNALTCTEDGLALARQYQDSYLTNYALCSLAMVFFLMDDAPTALLLLSEVDLKPGKTMSYEGCFHELIRGTVFLYQHRFEEASVCLNTLERITQQAGWKRRHLQVMVRLSACQLAMGQNTFAIQNIEKAVGLAQVGKYEHLMQVELSHQQTLSNMILMSPQQNTKEKEKEHKIVASPRQTLWNIQVNQPYLRTLALGIPTVLLDNKPITRWRMTRAIELYFFLIDSDRPTHKEQIITTLWPEADEQIDQTFRSAVHYLRKAIGDVCVIHHAGTYELNLQLLYGEHIWYDVAIFRDFYAQAKNALAQEDERTAGNAFQKMIELYRGDYIQSFYSDWCRTRREELLRMYMEALSQLAHITWKIEQIEESFHYWQKMLKIENLQEEAHYGIMRYYMRQGKRTQALRHYQQYEEDLRKELSAQPGATIQKFHEKIVQDSQKLHR